MALSTITHHVFQLLRHVIHDNKEYAKFALALAAGLLIAASWYGYRSYALSSSQSAFQSVSDCMLAHEKAMSKDAQWSDVESMASAALHDYKSTAAAPYLMACRIDALLAQGHHEDARMQSKELLSSLTKQNPLYAVFAIKNALLDLDYGSSAEKEHALTTLQAIASENKDWADRALYYSGLYYQSIGDNERADQFFNRLKEIGAHEDLFVQSPYLSLVTSYK